MFTNVFYARLASLLERHYDGVLKKADLTHVMRKKEIKGKG